MAQNETWLNHDLMQAVQVQYLDGNVFSMDNAGNLIGVHLTRDGVDYSGGGSVSANVIRADGATVAVSGALSGANATVVLPQAAYAVPGVLSVVIKLTVSGQITTIGAVVANVYQSTTDTTVDPGTIIPSIETLIAQIEAAVATIPADYSSLWTKLAPAFSSSTSYSVGQYVTYDGGLYRFTAAHAGTWSSSDVTAVTLGGEISRIIGNTPLTTTAQTITGAIEEHETDLGNIQKQITNIKQIDHYVNNDGTGANSNVYVNSGDVIAIDVNSITGNIWYAWVDGNGSHLIEIVLESTYYFTAESSGYIRLKNANNSGTIDCDIRAFTVAENEAHIIQQRTLNGFQNATSYTNDIGTASNSELYVYSGNVVTIEVDSITGNWVAWVVGNTSNTVSLYAVGQKAYLAATDDGYIRLRNTNNSGNIKCRLYLTTYYETPGVNVPALGEIEIKKTVVFNGVETVNKNYSTLSTNTTIYNYLDYASDSSVAKTTPPIQIRNGDGVLIYKNLDLNGKSSIESGNLALCAVTFDRHGVYLRRIEYAGYKDRSITWLDDEYYAILAEYPAVYPSLYWKIDAIRVDWLNADNSSADTIYTVGIGKDYETVTGALVDLANDSTRKIIYIDAGTYDIYEEMGGDDYFENLPDLEMSAWRQYCNLIPPNTKIIGIGKVVLNFNYPFTKNKNVFSCLNTSTGTYIENITVNQTGGRYGIHLEGGDLIDTVGNSYILKNVNVTTNNANYTIGVGMNVKTSLDFIDCMLVRTDKQYGACVYHHTNHHDIQNINFINCIVDGGIALQNTADYRDGTNTVLVKILNTYTDLLKIYSVMEGVTGSDYKVVTYGVNQYTLISENVTPMIVSFS